MSINLRYFRIFLLKKNLLYRLAVLTADQQLKLCTLFEYFILKCHTDKGSVN